MVKIKPTLCSEIVNFSKQTGFKVEYKIINDFIIEHYTSLSSIFNNSLVFCKNDNFYTDFNKLKVLNTFVICSDSKELRDSGLNYIITDRPRDLYFSIIDNYLIKESKNGVSNKSTVLTNSIGKDVYIGDFAYINENVKIGNNVKIYDNVSIICPCKIGDNTIIFSGAKLGADGFGMYKDINNQCYQIPHVGGIVIGKNAVVGSNTCIDRGTIDDTIIEDNVKIDNLCHIGHNVHIEMNSLITAGSVLGGSLYIKKNGYFAPGAIAMNGITIGENSLIGMGAVVTKSVESNQVVAGVPAKFIRENK